MFTGVCLHCAENLIGAHEVKELINAGAIVRRITGGLADRSRKKREFIIRNAIKNLTKEALALEAGSRYLSCLATCMPAGYFSIYVADNKVRHITVDKSLLGKNSGIYIIVLKGKVFFQEEEDGKREWFINTSGGYIIPFSCWGTGHEMLKYGDPLKSFLLPRLLRT